MKRQHILGWLFSTATHGIQSKMDSVYLMVGVRTSMRAVQRRFLEPETVILGVFAAQNLLNHRRYVDARFLVVRLPTVNVVGNPLGQRNALGGQPR